MIDAVTVFGEAIGVPCLSGVCFFEQMMVRGYRNEEIPSEQRASNASDFRVQKHFVPKSGSTSEFVYAAARQSFALTIKFV
jgi:hypothetical protein